MKYISGYLAMGVECELPTPGKWNITKQEFLDDELFKSRESDDSPFKNFGIEKDKLVPYREFCCFNVANHVRAYLDMLYDGEFELLDGMFAECINNAKARQDIFMCVYGKLRHLACFSKVNEFMEKEFGNAWYSYVSSVESMAEHIANRAEAIEEIKRIQEESSKVDGISIRDYDLKNLSKATIKQEV